MPIVQLKNEHASASSLLVVLVVLVVLGSIQVQYSMRYYFSNLYLVIIVVKMKSKYLVRVLALAVVALFPMQSYAENIAYVDARRLIDEAPQGKAEIKSLEEAFSSRNRDLKARIEEFELRQAELQKNAVIMSSDELQIKTNEMRDLQRALQREQQIYNEDYTRSRNQGLARLEKLISEVIIEMAIKEELDLVVQQAVYASRNIDFTDRVLEELSRVYEQ